VTTDYGIERIFVLFSLLGVLLKDKFIGYLAMYVGASCIEFPRQFLNNYIIEMCQV